MQIRHPETDEQNPDAWRKQHDNQMSEILTHDASWVRLPYVWRDSHQRRRFGQGNRLIGAGELVGFMGRRRSCYGTVRFHGGRGDSLMEVNLSDGSRRELAALLATVPDPRGTQGRRISLVAMLATIPGAVLCVREGRRRSRNGLGLKIRRFGIGQSTYRTPPKSGA